MDRKETARQTLAIMEQGYYQYGDSKIEIRSALEASVRGSFLITPQQAEELLAMYNVSGSTAKVPVRTENIATVEAVRRLTEEGKEKIGVLNFASAKNPGGGFINGAMAQEESLAASSTLYRTLTVHEEYYRENRAQRSMMYTNYAIYSPDVVFFRDGRFQLVEKPFKASVLTLPAVNMGQVLLKGEDSAEAERVMRRRMKLALAIFARQGARNLVLGAYGCGVFRNDPKKIAAWWKELLEDEGMGQSFNFIFHAVLYQSKNRECIGAFESILKN